MRAVSPSWFYGNWIQVIKYGVLFYFTVYAMQHYTWTTLAALVCGALVYNAYFSRFQKDILAEDLDTMRQALAILSTAREHLDALDEPLEPAVESVKLEMDRVLPAMCALLGVTVLPGTGSSLSALLSDRIRYPD